MDIEVAKSILNINKFPINISKLNKQYYKLIDKLDVDNDKDLLLYYLIDSAYQLLKEYLLNCHIIDNGKFYKLINK